LERGEEKGNSPRRSRYNPPEGGGGVLIGRGLGKTNEAIIAERRKKRGNVISIGRPVGDLTSFSELEKGRGSYNTEIKGAWVWKLRQGRRSVGDETDLRSFLA